MRKEDKVTFLISFMKKLVSLKKMTDTEKSPLIFKIFHECQTTKARTGQMILIHHHVDTPVFMPVGTQVSVTVK